MITGWWISINSKVILSSCVPGKKVENALFVSSYTEKWAKNVRKKWERKNRNDRTIVKKKQRQCLPINLCFCLYDIFDRNICTIVSKKKEEKTHAFTFLKCIVCPLFNYFYWKLDHYDFKEIQIIFLKKILQLWK